MRSLRALALLLFTVLLAGCYFDHPLTGSPSKDLNSWLLGVWEYKDDKGKVYHVQMAPLTASRYAVTFRALGKTPRDTKLWTFEGWTSRVGNSLFLSLKCLSTSGDIPEGAYTFVHYQVIGQNEVIIRPLQLDMPPDSSSYQLRVQIRRQLKEKSLLPVQGAAWKRISEVYWQKEDEWAPQPTQPLRYPPVEAAAPSELRAPEADAPNQLLR